MFSLMLRRLLGPTVVALASLTAACGGGDDSTTGPGQNPEPGASQATLYVSNDADRSVFYVFARACGTQNWGEDLLGTDSIEPTTSHSFQLAAGCYDVRAVSSPDGDVPGGTKHEVIFQNQTLAAGGSTIAEVDEWPAEPAGPVFAAAKLAHQQLHRQGRHSCLHRYDPTSNSWTELAIPTHQHEAGVGGAMGGKFYVVGGHTFNGASAILDVYDPASDTWATKAPRSTPRIWAAGAVVPAGLLSQRLYVVGGCDLGRV
jgi:hypothetical protein